MVDPVNTGKYRFILQILVFFMEVKSKELHVLFCLTFSCPQRTVFKVFMRFCDSSKVLIVRTLNPIRYGLFEVLSHMGGGPCGPPLDISAVGP